MSFEVPARESRSVKARALSAASQLLSEGPVEDLSLRAIADRAGIGLASIYHYFESKEDLLLRLALRGFADLRADLEAGRADTSMGGPMQGAAQAFFRFAARRQSLFSLMFDPRMLSRHADLRDAERVTFAVYEVAVRSDTRIPPENQDDTAVAIWALGRGMMAMTASHPGNRLPEDLSDRMSRGIAYLLNR